MPLAAYGTHRKAPLGPWPPSASMAQTAGLPPLWAAPREMFHSCEAFCLHFSKGEKTLLIISLHFALNLTVVK